MRKALSRRILKTVLIWVVFSLFAQPAITLPCHAKMNLASMVHECCQKGLCATKISQPPCCEGCRTAAPRAAAAPQIFTSLNFTPSLLTVLSPVELNLHQASIIIPWAVHSPPLYLSLKTFLC